MKTQFQLNRQSQKRAFTLVELLVVMVIIAVLAGVAFPVFGNVIFTAKMNAGMQSAKQIGLALVAYAGDHDGQYPEEKNSYDETIKTSNDAFRSLIPDYCDNEAIFVVPTSQWGSNVDGKIKTASEILKPGENHFAFVSGINSTSGSMKPLVVDGTDGTGFYTRDEQRKGGAWKGQKAILIRNDNSAKLVPLKGTDDHRFIPDTENEAVNMLDVGTTIGDGVKLLDPS